MNVGDLVDHCLSKPGAEETYPWGEQDLVAKVGGKAFAAEVIKATPNARPARGPQPQLEGINPSTGDLPLGGGEYSLAAASSSRLPPGRVDPCRTCPLWGDAEMISLGVPGAIGRFDIGRYAVRVTPAEETSGG